MTNTPSPLEVPDWDQGLDDDMARIYEQLPHLFLAVGIDAWEASQGNEYDFDDESWLYTDYPDYVCDEELFVLPGYSMQGSRVRENFVLSNCCPCCGRPSRDLSRLTRRTRLKSHRYGHWYINHRSKSKRKTLRTHRDGRKK